MTTKEKAKLRIGLTQIRSKIMQLNAEANDYDMTFHRSYVSDLLDKCEECLKIVR